MHIVLHALARMALLGCIALAKSGPLMGRTDCVLHPGARGLVDVPANLHSDAPNTYIVLFSGKLADKIKRWMRTNT